jgi:hypothetical protein
MLPAGPARGRGFLPRPVRAFAVTVSRWLPSGRRQAEVEEGAIKNTEDRIASVFFLVCSCLIMIESVRLKLDQIQEPGPGFVPFFLALTLAVLSAITLVFPSAQKKAAAFWNDWQRGQGIVYIFAGLVVYMLVLKTVGFYFGTFALIFFLMKMFGEEGYRRPLIVALLTVGATYLLFYKLLFIPFPQGILGI